MAKRRRGRLWGRPSVGGESGQTRAVDAGNVSSRFAYIRSQPAQRTGGRIHDAGSGPLERLPTLAKRSSTSKGLAR
jgi:hypothetical protein